MRASVRSRARGWGEPDVTATGGDRIWRAAAQLGYDLAVGLPGSQTVHLFQTLGASRLRTVVTTSELAASFLANGYARVARRPAVLITIPGPGLTYALSGLAEARLDSVPLLHLLPAPAAAPGVEHQLQAIDQRSMAAPVVKAVFQLERIDRIGDTLARASALAVSGEPGPVLVEVAGGLFTAAAAEETDAAILAAPAALPTDHDVRDVLAALASAARVVWYVGAGAAGAAAGLRTVAARPGSAFVTTTSGRGIVSEDERSVIVRDPGVDNVRALNTLLDRADLVLAVGCKFAHNGAAGFSARLPPDKLVTINTSGPSANYPSRRHVTADAGALLDRLLGHAGPGGIGGSGWDAGELSRLRDQARESRGGVPNPHLARSRAPVADLIAALRRSLPDDAIVVTDSGLHQMSIRRHFTVRAPGGLLIPSDFQSMGFGLPAAIGAALAAPRRRVVAVIGDGGMLMSGLELSTAVREQIPLTVLVFNDGAYGLIRHPQVAQYGTGHGTALGGLDFEALAAAVGASYAQVDTADIAPALTGPDRSLVHLVDVRLEGAADRLRTRALGTARRTARRLLPAHRRAAIRGWLRRR